MKKLKLIALSLAAAFSVASSAVAADHNIYLDETIPFEYGGNVSGPNGLTMNWFRYAESNAGWLGNEATAPVPQGTKYLLGTVGTWINWGGYGVQFWNSGTNTVNPQNMSAYAGGTLKFMLKSNRLYRVKITYDNGAGGEVTSNTVDINSTGGVWTTVSIPLTSAYFGIVDYTKIRAPFIIEIPAGPPAPYGSTSEIRVDYIRWEQPVSQTATIRPSSTRVNPGKHRQFLIEDALNPNLTLSPANLGSLTPTVGNETLFTANATIQSGNLNAQVGSGPISSASIQVTNANLDREYALMAAETITTGITPGTDADFFPYADALGSTITAVNNTSDLREGFQSTQYSANVVSGGYAGQAIEWTASNSTDMNEFYDGSIRFWFKGDPTLSGKMSISVRSFNVSAGNEFKVWLHNYVTFDNTWRPVTIPIAQLAGASPKADLSRMKVLFNVGISSPTSGAKAFYIDKLRWDTRTPGALNRITVVPGNVTIPLNLKQTFLAKGFDAAGTSVDIWPTWTQSGGIATSLSRTVGDSTQMTASPSATTGGLTATQVVSGSATVTVANIVFTQNFNVFSDIGSGGQIGVDNSAGSAIALNGSHTIPSAPEGVKVMHATFTVVNSGGYATWFDYEVTGTRYMAAYAQGYMHLWVRTTRDLEISIRSNNVDPATNRAKVRLTEIGIPLDNTWQEIWLSLNDFKLKEPTLDFSQMKVYFGIAAIQAQIGNTSNQLFDVDDVKWYTADPYVPDPEKVYLGLKNKQNASTGLVVTYDNDATNRAVTYDQALAAMAYTYHTDTALAKKVLDVYLSKYNAKVSGGGFNGFEEEYDRDTPSTIRDYDRTVGPNAWIMLAAMHYRSATNSTIYDGMINGIANWMISLQDPDGGIKFGFIGAGGTPATYKSTEHNFDVYAALKAWYTVTGTASYNTAANSVYTWLTTSSASGGAFNTAQNRFNVGELSGGGANTDYALDAFSWAPLALNGYEHLLNSAEALFVATKTVDVNGFTVTGFDFSGTPGNGTSIPYGQLPDKDAVWLEGTGHMIVAYNYVGRPDKAAFYLNELNKAIFAIAGGAQGMTYASNAGTAYWTGSMMDSTHAAISSMAWYYFANVGFNPLQPYPIFDVAVKNISNNAVTTNVTWTTNVPAHWVRANQYIQFRVQGVDTRPWGLQIYTDNTDAALPVRYTDPTPNTPNNADANPAGLLEILPGTTTVHHKLQMAWRVQDSTATAPTIARPYDLNLGAESAESYSWYYFKDKATPAIDANGDGDTTDPLDGTPFTNGEEYITVKTNAGIQTSGQSFNQSYSPDFIYLEADYGTASATITYSSDIILEFFIQ